MRKLVYNKLRLSDSNHRKCLELIIRKQINFGEHISFASYTLILNIVQLFGVVL